MTPLYTFVIYFKGIKLKNNSLFKKNTNVVNARFDLLSKLKFTDEVFHQKILIM